jgi:hypothetical protein
MSPLSGLRRLLLSVLMGLAPAASPPANAQTPGQRSPVLEFPELGLDDTARYRGYRTRIYRDAAGNTVQIYLDQREARVVHLFANAENESIGFTARDAGGGPAALRWERATATVRRRGRSRVLEHALIAAGPVVRLGHFQLGSMRVERDFQAWGRHRAPFDAAPMVLPEIVAMLGALEQLPPAVQREHLAHANAPSVAALRARLTPTVSVLSAAGRPAVRVVQPSLDLRDTMTLELSVDPRHVSVTRAGGAVELRAVGAEPLRFTVGVATTGDSLTPLSRREIFRDEFLAFVTAEQQVAGDAAVVRARWRERQIRGVELLASREKLMAGLPTYATYFGRDMMVTALMMEPIWRRDMLAFVVASALRRLSPAGDVSHEEALGGQAVREAAAEYATLVREARGVAEPARDSLYRHAGQVLRDQRRVRENYHMIDDDLQLPIVAARWLADPAVPARQKRAFLLDSTDGRGPRIAALLRALGVVARMTEPYVRDPRAENLISFAPRDSGRWASTSWRDSNAGYANGRYAMDVNAIWAPHALESVGQILEVLRTLGLPAERVHGVADLAPTAPLGRYARDPAALAAAADAWWGAERHFVVRLSATDVRNGTASRLAAMPATESAHWRTVLATPGAADDSLTFLALALDAQAQPIGVVNTDAATRLFLGGRGGTASALDAASAAGALRDVHTFVRAYPAGLLVDGIGPVAANDAYATPAVWQEFVRDPYHGPRVVWGREVNLFLLGVANQIAAARRSAQLPDVDGFVGTLRAAAERVQGAADASGFQSELWSYDFVGGRPVPVRYGSGADVQLWSTTDLVVQYVLSRMPR